MAFKKLQLQSLFFFIISFYCISVSAQQKLLLSDCIEMAIKNSSSIKNIELEKDFNRWEVKQKYFNLAPDVNVGYSHKVRSFNQPLAENWSIDWGNSGSYSISGSAVLFNWFNKWRDIRLSKIQVSQKEQEVFNKQFETYKSVVENFLNLILAKETYDALNEQKLISDSLFQRVEMLYRAGKIIQTDVDEANLQRIREENNIVKSGNSLRITEITLERILNSKQSIDIDYGYYKVKRYDETALIDYRILEESAFKNSPYFKMLDEQKKINALSYKQVKNLAMPNMSLNYSLSSGYSGTPFGNDIRFSRDLRNNYAGLVSLNISVPVFNGLKRKKDIFNQKLQVEKFENNYNEEIIQFSATLKQIHNNTQVAVIQYQNADEEVKCAKRIFSSYYKLYTNGKTDIFSVLNYKQKLIDVLLYRLKSKIELMANIETLKLYEKGIGLFVGNKTE